MLKSFQTPLFSFKYSKIFPKHVLLPQDLSCGNVYKNLILQKFIKGGSTCYVYHVKGTTAKIRE